MKDLYLRKTIKMMKGQLTLETIIMLVVLLVLAGVMITLILTTLKPPTGFKKPLSKQQFLQECQNFCQEKKFAEYCSYYWNGNDWNEDNSPSEVIKVSDGNNDWLACEDRIYCFLVTTCDDLGYGGYKIEACVDHIYNSNLMKFMGDTQKTKDATLATYSFSPLCSESKLHAMVISTSATTKKPEIDWYQDIIKKRIDELSGQGGTQTGGTTGGLSFQDCKINTNTKKIECSSNCQNAELLVITGKNKKGEDITIQGSPTISQGKISLTDSKLADVDCSQEINVVLVCKNPDDSKTASGSCTTS
jgi:hypothetical protein